MRHPGRISRGFLNPDNGSFTEFRYYRVISQRLYHNNLGCCHPGPHRTSRIGIPSSPGPSTPTVLAPGGFRTPCHVPRAHPTPLRILAPLPRFCPSGCGSWQERQGCGRGANPGYRGPLTRERGGRRNVRCHVIVRLGFPERDANVAQRGAHRRRRIGARHQHTVCWPPGGRLR